MNLVAWLKLASICNRFDLLVTVGLMKLTVTFKNNKCHTHFSIFTCQVWVNLHKLLRIV